MKAVKSIDIQFKNLNSYVLIEVKHPHCEYKSPICFPEKNFPPYNLNNFSYGNYEIPNKKFAHKENITRVLKSVINNVKTGDYINFSSSLKTKTGEIHFDIAYFKLTYYKEL